MYPVAVLRHGLRLLVPLAIASTIYIYFYPVFNGCAFPLPPTSGSDARAAFLDTARRHSPLKNAPIPDEALLAPFRLLAFGDPQLEGDTSIPTVWLGHMPHLKSLFQHIVFLSEHESLRQRIRQILHDIIDVLIEDVPNEIESARKIFDLFGNDFYLAHIYRTLRWWTNPTHITVLGDLVGSQWIDDGEFARRGWRFWNRVFRGTERVPDDLALYPAEEYDLAAYLGTKDDQSTAWSRRIINVAGNHDIGYAGDITEELLERFETVFGKANYELRFELPITDPAVNATIFDEETNRESDRLPPELRIVVVNDMILDTPARSVPLQDATYNFINDVITTASAVEFLGHFTLLLTHIPLFKPEGVCVDPPFFDFHTEEEGGGLKEQYQLSRDASKGFLEGMLGMNGDTEAPGGGIGRYGVILNGHDHAGCDSYHYINQTNGTDASERSWEVQTWQNAGARGFVGQSGLPGVREITVRSMMGDFGGYAGLFSAWFDEEEWRWKFEYATCSLGKHHGWWLVHVLDLLAVLGILTRGILAVLGRFGYDFEHVELHWEDLKHWMRTPAKSPGDVKVKQEGQKG